MTKLKLILCATIAVALMSCGNSKTNDKDKKDSTATTSTTASNTNEEVKKDGKIDPFKDFPKDAITAKVGDYALSPSENWQRDATEGKEKVTFIFYAQKIAEVGNEYSKIDFIGKLGVEIPNYMIIPIKSEQKVKKGDILLTWWQSGSGMMRAIVTDASNPSEPMVNYLDLSWTNPSKNSAGVRIGQQIEKLKPNSFHVISNLWEAGTSVAVKIGSSYKQATIIKVSGNKVLTIGFAGVMNVYAKEECTPIPVIPTCKAGDQVQVPWVGTFKNTKVQKVDTKNGRVWCDDPYSKDPLVVPFGDVITGLDIK